MFDTRLDASLSHTFAELTSLLCLVQSLNILMEEDTAGLVAECVKALEEELPGIGPPVQVPHPPNDMLRTVGA